MGVCLHVLQVLRAGQQQATQQLLFLGDSLRRNAQMDRLGIVLGHLAFLNEPAARSLVLGTAACPVIWRLPEGRHLQFSIMNEYYFILYYY